MLSSQYEDSGPLHELLLKFSVFFGYRLSDSIIAVSSGVARDLSSLASLDEKAIVVIYNPIKAATHSSMDAIDDAEKAWGVPPGHRILTVGNLKSAKNHPLLLRAFARLNDLPGARLIILGEGPLKAELRKLADELGITDRVTLMGYRSDPTPFYRTADLFVLSSDREGFPCVIGEALACGTPVVSTDCPSGPAEILADGKYGILVPTGDAEALANAIRRALAKPVDAAFLRERASDFDPEKVAAEYLHLIDPTKFSAP